MNDNKWTGKTQGWGTGIKIFFALIKHTGYIPAYALTIFVCAVYTVTNKKGREAIKDFRAHLGLKTGLIDHYAQFFSFSVSLIHRTGMLIRKNSGLKYNTINENYIENEISNGRGVILLSAHVGSGLLAGEILSGRLKATVNVLMVEWESEMMKGIFGKINRLQSVNIIEIGDNHIDMMLKVKGALDRGEIVAILGDRFVSENTCEVEFFGEKAKFPRGAFEIACITGAKIIPVFVTRKKLQFYEFRAREVIEIKKSDRANRDKNIDAAVANFAKQLSEQAKQTPRQWYNFYKFWN